MAWFSCSPEVDITVATLMQIDKLVLLLESPVFAYLRLQLLQPAKHRALVQTLYGIAMLLPQSTAFDTLARRLRCVGPLSMLQLLPPVPEDASAPKPADYTPLIAHFRSVQQRVRKAAAAAVAAAVVASSVGHLAASAAVGISNAPAGTPPTDGLAGGRVTPLSLPQPHALHGGPQSPSASAASAAAAAGSPFGRGYQ